MSIFKQAALVTLVFFQTGCTMLSHTRILFRTLPPLCTRKGGITRTRVRLRHTFRTRFLRYPLVIGLRAYLLSPTIIVSINESSYTRDISITSKNIFQRMLRRLSVEIVQNFSTSAVNYYIIRSYEYNPLTMDTNYNV